MTDEGKDIGMKIRYARERKGLSQKNLANSLRISAGYVSQIELGERNFDAYLLYRISKELKTPISSFYPQVDTPEGHRCNEIARFEHLGRVLKVCEE